MNAITINQPAYGPQGQPYCIKIRTEKGTEEKWFFTEDEAWQARDAAFDGGALSVAMKGIPFRGCVTGI